MWNLTQPNQHIFCSSEPAEIFEIVLVGATGGAVLGPQQVSRITISKSDSPNGVVRFVNESLITLANPDSTLKLSLVLERAGGLLGNATVNQLCEGKKYDHAVPYQFLFCLIVFLFTGCLEHPGSKQQRHPACFKYRH